MAPLDGNRNTDVAPHLLPLHPIVEKHHIESLQTLLLAWRARRNPPSVLLLSAAEGVGKRPVAHWLAQWILCEAVGLNRLNADLSGKLLTRSFTALDSERLPRSDSGVQTEAPPQAQAELAPCGRCPSCQKLRSGRHVDFLEILPEVSASADAPAGADRDSHSPTHHPTFIEFRGGTLKIEQFRDLKGSQGFSAHEGRFRVILISDAERMTVQAANSILKLLEEPPPGWVFLMTTSDPTLLLSTIVSRCQSVRLKPFSTNQIEEILLSWRVPPERATLCAQLAQGSLGKAELLAQDQTWESRQALFSFLQAPASSLLPLIDRTSQDAQQFQLLLDQLEQITLDLITFTLDSPSLAPKDSTSAGSSGDSPDPTSLTKPGLSTRGLRTWLNSDGAAALEKHSKSCIQKLGNIEDARLFWMERAEMLAQARRAALTPVNRKLLIQDLLAPWLEVSSS